MRFLPLGNLRLKSNPLLSIKHLMLLLLVSLNLVGCKEEITDLPALPVEPTSTQAVIYYNRDDGNYQDWGLHLWDAAGAAFVPDDFINDTGSTDWANPKLPDGISDDYGAYFIINFADENWTGFRFIMHKGDDKDLGGSDHYFDKAVYGNDLFTFSGNGELFPDPLIEAPININNASAHWLTKDILVVEGSHTPELIHSPTADIEIDQQTNELKGGESISLTAVEFPAELQTRYPHLTQFKAWQLPSSVDVGTLLTQQLIVSLSSEDKLKAATQVQLAGVLDDLYANKAEQLELFPKVSEGAVTLWAPTARSVELALYDEDASKMEKGDLLPMEFDTETGAWSIKSEQIQHGRYYRFLVEVYHPLTRKIEQYEVADPYSVSSSVNSEYSQFIDLSAAELKPANWENATDHQVETAEQISIYEIHVRDLTQSDQQGSKALNGKYLAV